MDWNEIFEDQDSNPALKPIPEGWQPVRVASAEGKTASTGSPMVTIMVEVEGGPHNGRQIPNNNIVLKLDNPVAMRMSLRRFNAFGITREWLTTNNPSVAEIAKAMLGRTAEANIQIGSWQGEDRNEINQFRPRADASAGGAPPRPNGVTGPPAPTGPPAAATPGPEPTATTGPSDAPYDPSAEPF